MHVNFHPFLHCTLQNLENMSLSFELKTLKSQIRQSKFIYHKILIFMQLRHHSLFPCAEQVCQYAASNKSIFFLSIFKIHIFSTYSVFGVNNLSSFWSLRHVRMNSFLVTLPSLFTSILWNIPAARSYNDPDILPICHHVTSAPPGPAPSPIILQMLTTMRVISAKSIHPLPSTSYMLKHDHD